MQTPEQDKKTVEIVKDYTKKCIEGSETNGMIITGASGIGKTHLAAAIANKLVEDGKIVLMGRLTTLLDKIWETFLGPTVREGFVNAQKVQTTRGNDLSNCTKLRFMFIRSHKLEKDSCSTHNKGHIYRSIESVRLLQIRRKTRERHEQALRRR